MVDLAGGAPVIEVGTGPGHVAAFLAEAGADATGLDITPEMVDEARRRYPGVSYQVGDLRRLMRPDHPRRVGRPCSPGTRSSISPRPN